ncbi:MAG: hypothetical protein WB866_10300 [Solirubrobacterales bacterium]
MSASRKFVLAFVLALAGLAGAAANASATFHFMKIREVSAGTGAPDSSYLEVQMYAPFQNFLSNGAALLTCNSDCSTTHMFSPFTNVANGNSQDTVVFGDSGLASASKDFNVDLNLNSISAAGAVCYLGEPGYRDCVAWGTFTGASTLTGTYGTVANPGAPSPALVAGTALRRSIAPGCATLLEASDDTNDSSLDFSSVTPNPRPNSFAPTEAPCGPGGGGGPTGYPPTSSPPAAPPTTKKKCKKHKHRSAQAAKKCKKHR